MPTITEALVKTLRPSETRRMLMDDKLPGFGVRINSTKLAYIYRYRLNGRSRIHTIGPVSAYTAAQARERAKSIATIVFNGIDPSAERQKKRDTPLFREFAQTYLEMTQKKSLSDDEQKLNQVLIPAWGSKFINSITPTDVRKLLHDLSKKNLSPATINRYRSLVSVLFSRAIEAGYLHSNPVKNIKKLPENNERVKWLNDAELKCVLDALQDEPMNSRNVILLCLLTGRRRGDIMQMKWEHVDFEAGFWHIPDPKDKRKYYVPLTPPVISILEEQKEYKHAFNPYIFPGRHGNGHISTVQRTWERVRSKAGLNDFRLHDLRHNYASRLASAGHDLYMIGQLLGHTDTRTTRRYSHL